MLNTSPGPAVPPQRRFYSGTCVLIALLFNVLWKE
jgi:hypothetical protein